MAYYNLKKKPSLTTKEGDKETMYADIVYSGTITAEVLSGQWPREPVSRRG